tara:strand:+ start:8753 stop:9031 length:279 start_codon:yes stop_codon:yes gene_type:complete
MPTTKKKEDLNVEELLKKKFFCSSKFTQEIEKIVLENTDISYIDAILSFCEVNNIELETVPKLITKPLKEKLKYEAMNLNFLKKTSKAKLVF